MNLLDRLSSGRPILLDGGMGSMLLAAGLPPGAPPEAWNLEHPDRVAAVHRAFVAAGSEAVQTNTFGGTPIRLAACGLLASVGELHRAAVDLARASGAALVIGDVGPTGEYLPPVGAGDPERWFDAFADQGRALAGAGVDAFHVETMSDLREAMTALRALAEVAPSVPVLVSMTFEKRPRGFFTVMGDPLVESLASLGRAGAAAVGANCSITSGPMRELAAAASGSIGVPLVLQPNAGTPRPVDGGLIYDQAPEEFADDLAAAIGPGVGAVGGCCGTDPRFLAALGRRLGRRP